MLLTLPAAAVDPGCRLTDYEHRHWSMVHGLPHATVRAVHQTPDGYLWAATEYGLARFNGERFFAFTSKNTEALMRPFLNALASGPDGSLWIGSEGGGWITWRQGGFRTFGTNENLAGLGVRGFAPRAKGGMWLLCNRGVNLWITGRLERLTIADLPANTINWSLLEDRQGNLWLGTDRGLFGPMDSTAPTALPVRGLTARQVFALAEAPDGQLWAGTDGGLYSVTTSREHATASMIKELQGARVRAVYPDRHGTVWVGTTTGLRRLRQRQLIQEEQIPQLRNTSVFAFYEDREANFWIGAGNGLHCLNDRTFVTVSAPNGLKDEEVITITETAPGRFLMGTFRGEVYEMTNGLIQLQPRYQREALISAIHQDRQGRVWIGARRSGLLCEAEGKLTLYNVANGLRDANVFAVAEDRKGQLWVGTESGLNRREGPEFAAVDLPVSAGRPQPVIRSLYVARDDSLWVGTQEGVYHLQPNATNYYGTAQGFPASLVYFIFEDQKGHLWLGTAQGAVCRWAGQWRLYKPTGGFPTWHVYWLAHDEQGFTWFATPWTIFRLETARIFDYWRGERPLPSPTKFTQSDGLLAMECLGGRQSAGCQTSDGHLIFLTRRGLAITDPNASTARYQPPRVVIERLKVNGREHPLSPRLELAAGSRVIEIDYAGLSYRQPETVRYRYQLTGVDGDWVDANQRRTATYANLVPGRYEFRVTADDGRGAWSAAGAGVELTITPFFYQTAWFYGAVIVVGVLAVYGGYQWRLRLLQKRNAILTASLAERTRELERAMTEKLRLEQAALARKQEETIGQMAAGIAHHLNNQLQAIQTSASLLQDEENIPGESRRHLAYIDKAIGKSARIVEQLLSYGQRHWLRMRVIQLQEFLPRVLAKYPGGRVRVEWMGELPKVKVDANILEQALLVVLDNALQAAPAQTAVKVQLQTVQRVPAAAASPAMPQTGPEQPYVQIQVLDEGPGLSPEALAHLFEPFFTTKDVGQGTGMGLAAAYGGLKQIGGGIEVANRPEGGCVVRLFLPVAS